MRILPEVRVYRKRNPDTQYKRLAREQHERQTNERGAEASSLFIVAHVSSVHVSSV